MCSSDLAHADWPLALQRYEQVRRPRASHIQSLSNLNKRNWMRVDPNAPHDSVKEKSDPDWVYGYDACTAPLQ